MSRKSLRTTPFLSLIMSAFLASCGGGSDGPGTSPPPPPPPPPPPAANAESVGGIWEGTTETEAPADVSTSFEEDATGPFDIGVSPYTASFSAGTARTDADTTLQNTGTFAWHIPASTTANVTFESNPQTLSLFARNAASGAASTIEILNDHGVVIQTASPGDSFQEVALAGTTGDSRIGSIRITNSSAGDVVIDDLTFGYLAHEGTIDCVVSEDSEYACTLRNSAADSLRGGVTGTLSVSGTQDVSGTGRRYAVLGSFLPNGTRGADLTVSSGTVSERTTLDLTMTASGLTTTATMTYDEDYEKGSALANVEGNYIPNQSMLFGNELDPYIIDTAGVITAAFTTPGGLNCTVSGQVSIIDEAWNAYDVSMNLTGCGIRDGDYTGLGITRDVAGTNDRFAVRIFSEPDDLTGENNDITGFGGGNK